ncbi:hypothetical protein DY000_02009705 [Brassica cretica]|uniref:Uncharacterized protein n=1 Tax=Brassica cretica TaxID=69181 RepID=A0ABQ7BU46_BRACR|nr:hypothetical protein DY000_02009705 [Brassica cretica]
MQRQENVEKDVGKDGDQHWKTVNGPRPSLEALEVALVSFDMNTYANGAASSSISLTCFQPLAILSEEQETDMLEEGEISDTIRL